MGESEEEIWLSGEPLSDLFARLEEVETLSEPFLPIDLGTPPDLPEAQAAHNIKSISQAVLELQHSNKIRRRAIATLEAMMLRGEFIAYGVWRDQNDVAHIKELPPRFWLDANISPATNTVENGPDKATRIRVVEKASTSDPLEGTGAAGNTAARNRGRPSQAKLIKEAIAECEHQHPDIWGQSPDTRRKLYFDYIREATGMNPLKQSGFSDKTIGKFETDHRRRN